MRRLLFVDDEQQVLDAMRNLMRRQRKLWDMAFALSGQAALDEMKKAPFDVVVSDMRMPGMDGCQLLEHVRELYPNTARIVLSGHAERDAVTRALTVAHQFLSKPCDSDTLRTAIDRTCTLHSTLMNPAIRRIVGAMERSPTLPPAYFELARICASPDFAVATISSVIERDPQLNARITKLLRSPMVGLPATVTSLVQASVFLGADWARGAALAIAIYEASELAPVEGVSITALRASTMFAARIARTFFREPQRGQEAYIATLGIGQGHLIAALGDPAAFVEVNRAVAATGRPRHEVEREKMGTTCAEIGGSAFGTFGMPFSIVEAVAFHCEPAHVTEGPRELVGAVHAAFAFAEGKAPDAAFFAAAGLTDELARWKVLADAEVAQRPLAA